MNGYINLIKPIGPSSFQMIREVRRVLGEKKIGHTGTLDPGAAGILPICIGKATKAIPYIDDRMKSYRAEITFGITTDTQDIFGTVQQEKAVNIEAREVAKLLDAFKGRIMQIPPMYSALKVKGRKLYELAREGKVIERTPREVFIEEIELIEYIPPDKAVFDVRCSKGTYVRTLCHDVGKKSGYGAVMSFLVRTASGCFHMNNAVTIEEVAEAKHNRRLNEILLPLDYPLFYLERVDLTEGSIKYAQNGNPLKPHNIVTILERFSAGQRVRIYSQNKFIGIGRTVAEAEGKYIKIEKVF